MRSERKKWDGSYASVSSANVCDREMNHIRDCVGIEYRDSWRGPDRFARSHHLLRSIQPCETQRMIWWVYNLQRQLVQRVVVSRWIHPNLISNGCVGIIHGEPLAVRLRITAYKTLVLGRKRCKVYLLDPLFRVVDRQSRKEVKSCIPISTSKGVERCFPRREIRPGVDVGGKRRPRI